MRRFLHLMALAALVLMPMMSRAQSACTFTLPYSTDWEDIAYNGAWPSCWDSIVHAGTDPSVNNVSAHSGTYSMYLQATASGSYNMFATSEPISQPGNAIYVDFWARLNSSTDGWIQAGVMTDPSDTSTFIPLVTIQGVEGWHEYEFNTGTLSASASYYVAFKAYRSVSYNIAIGYVDDITIAAFNGCNHVYNLTATDIDTGSLTLNWVDSLNSGATYTITYIKNGETQTLTSNTTSVAVTGLSSNTSYTFTVVANCSATAASNPVSASFKTACGTTPCQMQVDISGYAFSSTYYGAHITLMQGDYVIGDYTSSATVDICPGLPVKVSLGYSNYSYYYFENSYVAVYDGGGTELYNNSIDAVGDDGILVLVTDPCPTCFRPDSLAVSEIATDGAQLSWVASEHGETEWAVYANGVLQGTTTTPAYTLSGLNSNMQYNVDVKSVCAAGDTSYQRSITFRTACADATCELHVTATGSGFEYGYAQYELYQDSSLLGTYTSSADIEVCSSSPVTVTASCMYSFYSADLVIRDGGYNTVFTGSANDGVNYTIDTLCPSCIPPIVTLDEQGEDYLNVNIVARGDESLFVCKLNGEEVGTTGEGVYAFNDLTANTAYVIEVAAICDGDTTVYTTLNLRTACEPITLPYLVDFEDIATNGAWYPCWDSVMRYNTDPSVNNTDNHTPGGQYSMYMQAAGYNLVVSPQIPVPGNTISVSFWANIGYYGNWIKAGVMTNPRDTSTFIPMVTVTGSDWAEYTFNTSSLDADATYYIAWMGYNSRGYTYGALGHIDDVSIAEYTGCDKPEVAVVDSVGPYAAYLHWNGNEDALSYTVAYSTTNDFNSDNVVETVVTDTMTTLLGLMPQTTYYAWVRTNCGMGDSDYKSFGSFTTALTCAPVINPTLANVNYTAAQISWEYDTTMGFPTLGATVFLVDNQNSEVDPVEYTATGNSITFTGLEPSHSYTAILRNVCQTDYTIDSAAAVSFTFMTLSCAEITGLTSTTNAYVPTYTYYGNTYSQMIYPAETMPSIDTIHGIAFNIASTSNTSSSAVRSFDVYMGYADTTVFANGDSWIPVSSLTLVKSNFDYDARVTGWQSIPFDSVFVYDGSSNLVVAVNDHRNVYNSTANFASHEGSSIYAYRDGSSYDPTTPPSGTVLSTVPDIQFMANCEVPTCFAPMVSLYHLDSNHIGVIWVPVGEATTFALELKSPSDADYVYYGATTDTFYTFNALIANTAYTVRIGSICGDDTVWGYMNVRTDCGDMVLPYTEDFETQNQGEAPSCWIVQQSATVSGTTYPAIATEAHAGSQAMMMSGTSCMVSTAPINTGGMSDQLYISFWGKVSANYASATAGVLTNPDDMSTYMPLVTLTNDGQYHLYELYTTSLAPDTTYYLAFNHTSTYGYSNYYSTNIDDVNIRMDDGCHRPQNLTATADSNSVSLEWGNDGSVYNYMIQYREAGTGSWIVADSVPDTSYYLYGLLAATHYDIRVGNVCPTGDTMWAATDVTTHCGLVAVPYFEDFDSPTGTLPECWDYTNASIFHWNRWTDHAETSGDGELMAGSGSAGEAVILPELNGNFYKLEISFDGKVGNYDQPADAGDGFLMGAYDDATGVVTWGDTLRVTGQSRENFVRFTYNYLNFSGTGNRIAIGHAHNNPSDWGFAIDNINVRELPDCYPPENLTVNNTMYPNDPDSINVTWTCSGDALEWELYYDTITSTVSIDSIDTTSIITVNEMSYHFPAGALDAGARYRLFVRSKCGIDHSAWVEVQNGFATNEYWMNNTGTFDTLVGCNFIIYDNGGPVAGYLHNSNSAVIIRSNDPGNEIQLRGATFGTGSDANALNVYDGEGTSGTLLYTYTSYNTQESFDSVLATSTEGAMTITFTSGYYAGLGYELYVHCVEGASCHRPTSLVAEADGHLAANISWTGNASTYRVYYRESGTTAWNTATATSDSLNLTGLQPATTYDIMVRGICSDTDSSLTSHVVQVTTDCAPVQVTATLSYEQDFENSTDIERCFSMIYGDNNPNINTMGVNAAAAHNGNNGFRFNSLSPSADYNQYLVTPSIDADGNMLVQFYVKASAGTETFRMGYSTTDNDVTASFIWNNPVTVNSTWTLYSANVPAATRYVAIHYMPGASSYYLYVDSLSLSITDDSNLCLAPAISAVTEDATTITVNYVAPGTVEAAITSSAWNSSITGTLVSDTTAYTFTGLVPGTNYTIGLRTVCGDDNYSPWTTQTVTTLSVDCNAPTNVTVSDIDFTEATVDWTSDDATEWQVYYTQGTQEDTIITTVHPVTLTGLDWGASYTVKVRTVCVAGLTSGWSTPVTFNTTGCEAPHGIYAGSVTMNEADIHWTSDASEWDLSYGVAGEDAMTTVTVTSQPYRLSGLIASTEYQVLLRAHCAEGIASEWSSAYTFRTADNQGIDDVEGGSVRLFPNPASTSVTLTLDEGMGQVNIVIVDMNGREVAHYQTTGTSLDIDVTKLAQGAYFVRVVNEQTTAVRKLIVR